MATFLIYSGIPPERLGALPSRVSCHGLRTTRSRAGRDMSRSEWSSTAPRLTATGFVVNFDFTDVKERYVLEMVNGVLDHTPRRQAKNADARR
jgi:hypothetical protein